MRPVSTSAYWKVRLSNPGPDGTLGKGKQFLNQGGIIDKVLGGWTLSSIVTFQSGNPFRVFGSYNTFNDINDGGVVLNGITAADFKKHMGTTISAYRRSQHRSQ